MEGVDYWDDSQRDSIEFMEDDATVVKDDEVISPKLAMQSEDAEVIGPNVASESDAQELAQIVDNRSGVVGEHLDEEIERGDLKVEQTGHDIHRLMNQAARLRTIKRQAHERYPAPDALILVQAVGDCLVHLESTIALMEAKNELTEANVSIARQCQAALDKYGNNFPAIPKDM